MSMNEFAAIWHYVNTYFKNILLFEGSKPQKYTQNIDLLTESTKVGTETSNVLEKNKLNYSTEEQLTGKRWIDGKPIYQKTLCGGDIVTVFGGAVRVFH